MGHFLSFHTLGFPFCLFYCLIPVLKFFKFYLYNMDGLESTMLKENASLKNYLSYESFYMKYPG